MTGEQIGGVIFWTLFAALVMALAGGLLGIRVRVRALMDIIGILMVIGGTVWAIVSLPPEIVGGGLLWSSLGGMFFGLFWALTRGK